MFANSPVFEPKQEKHEKGSADETAEAKTGPEPPAACFVGHYPRVNPLMSGWIGSPEALYGKGALVRASFGEGQAVLVGFRCQFRGQTHGTFKVLFNAILAAGQVPEVPEVPEVNREERLSRL